VPQAQPCPPSWRGRLWQVRYAQVRWLLDYISSRYGDPLHALWFRQTHSWF
jgi:predicted amidophosphoribosyltransferase